MAFGNFFQRFRFRGMEISPEKTPQEGVSAAAESGDENTARGNWSGRFDFILSSIGYAVGLGNVWRFPYLCYRNGGGAFLIPYLIMLAVAALPLFYLELAFGQFANLGPITIWRACPILKGTGWAMVAISFLVSIYYNVIIAWSLYYMFASLTTRVPWADCDNAWNDLRCRDLRRNTTNTTHNVPGNPNAGFNQHHQTCPEGVNVNCTKYQTPSEQYFERVMLGYRSYTGVSKTMTDPIGFPQWHVTLCLLLAWIMVYACILKGIKTSGKVVYFTATFPYVVLLILLIRGVTLDGALEGIIFYLKPDFAKLKEAQVWSDAAVQIFYSLGLAFGGLMTMASYNKFKNNCYRDAIVVATINSSTSIFAGFAIFSVIGFMARKTGLPVAEVASSGPSLAFIAYPEGLAAMPVSPLWSVLFFMMLLTLGLDSQFTMVETVLTSLVDELEWLRGSFKKQAVFKALLCFVMFLLGLPLCCPGGMYYFTLLNDYSANYNLLIVALVELIGISCCYGIRNFLRDVEMMLGFKPGFYWVACWTVVTPCMILFILVFSLIKYSTPSYDGNLFPPWGSALCWLLMLGSVLCIPGFAIAETWKRGGLSWSAIVAASTEDLRWGPSVECYWLESSKYLEKMAKANGYSSTVNRKHPAVIPTTDAAVAYTGAGTDVVSIKF